MTELADKIEVNQADGQFSFRINGEEFPYYISSDGVQVHVSDDNSPSVTVTILANKVEVEHGPFQHVPGELESVYVFGEDTPPEQESRIRTKYANHGEG